MRLSFDKIYLYFACEDVIWCLRDVITYMIERLDKQCACIASNHTIFVVLLAEGVVFLCGRAPHDQRDFRNMFASL
jgi:hypothetical protein